MPLMMNSVVRRHMKQVERFVFAGQQPLPDLANLAGSEERVLGWYDNPPPYERVRLLFTDQAIHVVEAGESRRLLYLEIVDYTMPESKEHSTGVWVQTRESQCFVRMAGRSGPGGKFNDTFALIPLLHIVRRVNTGTA
jgi:hypothetical protein